MLYIFSPDEQLVALLKPDFSRSTGPAPASQAFLAASFPAEFDREPAEGCPYWDALHREVLNGENTLTFTVPANQADAAHVREGNLVAFKDLDGAWQFFEIMRLTDIHGDGLTRTAFCEHIFYELLNEIVTDRRPSNTAVEALAVMLEGTRWQVGIVDDLGASNTNAYYESALSAVQKVANAWQGELRWRIIVANNQITERRCDLLAMRGTDTGKQFAYSKDILSIEREVETTEIVTALYGRGKGVETESGGYGRRLTFAEVAWSTATGDPVDKPYGQEWVGDPGALAQWGRPGDRHRFGVFTDDDETDPSSLLQKTWGELQRRKDPRATYRLDVVSLEQLAGYSHEAVRLGDLVRVIDREFRPKLIISARVIELERNLLAAQDTKVVLGSFAPSIVTANINTQRRVKDLENKPYNTKWLDGVINLLQNAIEDSAAYLFHTPGEGLLILNAPTYDQATEAMLIGGGRFALANQKDGQGGWDWRTFGTGSGFTADEINAGILNASLVSVISGDNAVRLLADGLKIYNGDNQVVHTGKLEEGLGDQLATFIRESVAHKQNLQQVAVNEPRFEAAAFGQGLTIEEGTVNKALYSQQFDHAAWDKATYPCSVTADAATAPDGTATMDKITAIGGANRHVAKQAIAGAEAGHRYVISGYLKKGDSNFGYLGDGGDSNWHGIRFNLDTGAIHYVDGMTSGGGITSVGGGVYRCWVRFNRSNAGNFQLCCGPASITGEVSYTPAGTPENIYAWGLQLEEKAYPTSYMATISSTATRAAETLAIPTAGVFTKGAWAYEVIYTPYIDPNNGDDRVVHLWSLWIDEDNYYSLRYDIRTGPPLPNSPGYLRLEVRSGGTDYIIVKRDTQLFPGSEFKIMISGDGSVIRLCVDGLQIGVDLSYVEPAGELPPYMYVGSDSGGENQASGIYDDLRISSRARTLAEHQAYVASGQPHASDEGTTLLMSMDGDLVIRTRSQYGTAIYHSDGSYTMMTADGIDRYVAGKKKHYQYLVHVGEGTTQNSPYTIFYHGYLALVTIPVIQGDPDWTAGGSVWGYNLFNYTPDGPFGDPSGTGPGNYQNDIPTDLITDKVVQLPDEFKGKDFQVFLYPKKIYTYSNILIYAGLSAQCGQPQNYLALVSKDVPNGRFTVRGYTYQRYDRMRQWYGAAAGGITFAINNGSYITTSYTEWELSRVLQGMDFGYIAIY